MLTCKRPYFIILLWRYGWFRTPVILLVESILAHKSGTRCFSNMGFVKFIANNINFHYWTNPEKINDQIFSIKHPILRPRLDPIFPHFRGNFFSSLNLTLSHTTPYWFRRSGVFLVNFEHISHLVLVFLLPTSSR